MKNVKEQIEALAKVSTENMRDNNNDNSGMALRFSQAALNLAHVTQILSALPKKAKRIRTELKMKITEDQIDHMVHQFLNWKLPHDFNPDGGITFNKTSVEGISKRGMMPSGTNLFDFNQVREMVRHMITGMP